MSLKNSLIAKVSRLDLDTVAVKDLAPPVACKTFGFEQQSIAESALAAGQNLATMYCIFVLLGFGWVLTVGSFTSSRHAFRALLQKGRHAKVAR